MIYITWGNMGSKNKTYCSY